MGGAPSARFRRGAPHPPRSAPVDCNSCKPERWPGSEKQQHLPSRPRPGPGQGRAGLRPFVLTDIEVRHRSRNVSWTPTDPADIGRPPGQRSARRFTSHRSAQWLPQGRQLAKIRSHSVGIPLAKPFGHHPAAQTPTLTGYAMWVTPALSESVSTLSPSRLKRALTCCCSMMKRTCAADSTRPICPFHGENMSILCAPGRIRTCDTGFRSFPHPGL